jgi:pyruvate kinase
MNHAPGTARRLLGQIRTLREEVVRAGDALGSRWRPLVADTAFRKSAQNLAHYLVFRRRDLRTLQQGLSPLGVSSLGRCEAHVLPTLDAVLATLAVIAGTDPATVPPRASPRTFIESERSLARQAVALLGRVSAPRSVRIMVTLPTEAAGKQSWMRRLLKAGADCARINCAHDDPTTWMKMIRNVRAAAHARGRPCKILMDLAGPRARTEDVLTPGKHSRVQVHDRILLTRGKKPAAHPEIHFQARCSLPDVFAELKPKQLVCFNEGRIRAKVERITADGAQLRVVAARPNGEKFRSDMALNFPDTDLHISSLTDKDLVDLDFIIRHADLVGYSFVQRPEDISVLLGELDARRARFGRKTKLGIVGKIETARAVLNLPEIIVRAAGRGPFGIMIARGDLAVEVGYLRVAELQEEILWLCEAAHIPVIWATQVLETLAKKGVPTRAEITDAAMAERAECVMLNKGPFILDAVRVLDSVLTRMAGHYRKKTATLRALHSWDHLVADTDSKKSIKARLKNFG